MEWERSLDELTQELSQHEGYPCITLTLPTARTMPDNAEDPVRLKNLVSEVRARLVDELGKRGAAEALANLDEAAEAVDHNRNYEGLALFANSELAVSYKTRFPLPESASVEDRFSLRSLLRSSRRSEAYTVLALSLEEARLFTGEEERLEEVTGGGFPSSNRSYGAGSKAPGGLGVSTEAAVDDSRRRFMKDVLEAVAERDDVPSRLVAAGTPEILANVHENLPSTLELLGTISGSLIHVNPAEVGAQAFEVVKEARRRKAEETMALLDQARSAHLYESGVQALAPLALEGRIHILVTAFDHSVAGRVDEVTGAVELLEAPEGPSDQDDVVEWLIHKVTDTGGQIRFVGEGIMTEAPIAAILRW